MFALGPGTLWGSFQGWPSRLTRHTIFNLIEDDFQLEIQPYELYCKQGVYSRQPNPAIVWNDGYMVCCTGPELCILGAPVVQDCALPPASAATLRPSHRAFACHAQLELGESHAACVWALHRGAAVPATVGVPDHLLCVWLGYEVGLDWDL